MARTHQQQRDALASERAARKATYSEAAAKRDEIAVFASGPEATDFDRRELARAQARVDMALQAMRQWNDPIELPHSTAPEGECSHSRPTGAVEAEEIVAARILASDTVPGEGRKNAEVDAIAARIAAA